MSEYDQAVRIANSILDDPGRDPDSDFSVVCRQFLRLRQRYEYGRADTNELIRDLREGPVMEREGPAGIELFDLDNAIEIMHQAADEVGQYRSDCRSLLAHLDYVIEAENVDLDPGDSADIERIRNNLKDDKEVVS